MALKGRTISQYILAGITVCAIVWCILPASAATTEVHIFRYAADNVTVLNETTVSAQWMEANLPVLGDGTTHYYNQGPVFIDDPDPALQEELRWNPAEDTNVKEKDMGAVKGTALRDLCELAGGMKPGETVKIGAEDGFVRTFAYENVYTPSSRQGPIVIAWYARDEGYVPEYRSGMRLLFLADTSTNPYGLHVFGNSDWRASAAPAYWYFYRQGDEKYPTTTGLSVQYVSDIMIFSAGEAQARSAGTLEPPKPGSTPTKAALSPVPIIAALAACGLMVFFTRKGGRT